jgi:hypothetical protein
LASREIQLKEKTEDRLARQGAAAIDLQRKGLKLKRKEVSIRSAYMDALTSTQELQNQLIDQRIKSRIVDLERQAAAHKVTAAGQQTELFGMKLDELKRMMNSSDEEERAKARAIAIGYDAVRDSNEQIKLLTLQNQQMATAIRGMTFELQQDKARQNSASEVLNLAVGLSEAGLAKEIFGEEGEPFMKQAVRNAFVTYLGGEPAGAETVPPIAPETDSWWDRFLGRGKVSPEAVEIERTEESKALEEELKR